MSVCLQNVVSAASSLLQLQHVDHWRCVEKVHGSGAELLVTTFQKYAANLVRQQSDTYTTPFEVAAPNMSKHFARLFFFFFRIPLN